MLSEFRKDTRKHGGLLALQHERGLCNNTIHAVELYKDAVLSEVGLEGNCILRSLCVDPDLGARCTSNGQFV